MTRTPNRRAFLKLAAAGLAGPLLPLQARAQADPAGAKPPLRMLTIVDGYGITGDRTASWIRAEAGNYPLAEADLGWALQPLAAYRANMVVVSNMISRSRAVLGGSAAHWAVNPHTLTGSRVTGGRNNNRHWHPSIDVFLGHFLNTEYGLPFRRIYPHIAMSGFSYGVEGLQARHLGSPESVHRALFGQRDTTSLSAQRLVLEQIERQLQVIRPQLVQANANTVADAYATSVQAVARELELRRDLVCAPPAPDAWPGAATRAGVAAYFDAAYHMFACDLVSSVSLSFNGRMRHTFLGGDPDYGDIATEVGQNHHALSHRGTPRTGPSQALIFRWRNQLLAGLLDRLAATPDIGGAGSILDNTLVFFTCAMAENTHRTNTSIPTFIIGGGNTNLIGGSNFDATDRSNNDVMTTLAQALGSPIPRFGGYRGGNYAGGALNSGPFESILKAVL